MGYIYMIKNNINNKIYIGQTQCTIEKRFSDHKKAAKYGEKNVLYKAMRKYGIDKFTIEIIEKCKDDKLNEREKYWIKYYDTYNKGYNMTLGGEGRVKYNYKEISNKYLELKSEKDVAEFFNCSKSVVQHACESNGIKIKKGLNEKYWNSEQGFKRKEKLKEQMKNLNKNKNFSDKHRKKLSDSHKGKTSWCKGKKLSEEHKKKLSENSGMAKKIKCIETGIIYKSQSEAAKELGLFNSNGISRVCLGKQKTCAGYHWMFI